MGSRAKFECERHALPTGDYVSPEFAVVRLDSCFPNMRIGDGSKCPWPYLRYEIPHNWYEDLRFPTVGFINRDEAHIVYNTALRFQVKRALEIGCWMGWSACHLALAGVQLDVIDPILADPRFLQSVRSSLECTGVLGSVNLLAGASPRAVEDLADRFARRWSLFFIDGHHGAPAPIVDATVCAERAEADALILFHDLTAPDVCYGLDYLRLRGWNTIIYSTQQIMGAAWRGNVEPVHHQPDPAIRWEIPSHLQSYRVSGMDSGKR